MPIPEILATYPLDPTGQQISNKVTGEQHVITPLNYRDYHFIVPYYGPIFATGLVISYRDLQNNVRVLQEGIDYQLTHWFIGASRGCAKPVYGSISFMDLTLVGVVTLQYQTLGGDWTLDGPRILTILADRLRNPRVTSWEMVSGKPTVFPVINHPWDLQDMVGMTDLVTAINNVTLAIQDSVTAGYIAHTNAVNPHGTSAVDVGAYTIAQVDALISANISDKSDELYFESRS